MADFFYAHKTVQSRFLTYSEFKKILESGCQIIAQLCYLRSGHIQDYEKGLNIDGHVVLCIVCFMSSQLNYICSGRCC